MKLLSTLPGGLVLCAAASAFATAVPPAPAADHAGLLADVGGMTLYVSRQDTLGISHCNGACTKPWPPFIARNGLKAGGDFSIIRRDDGRAQWAYKGQPLYRFAGDAEPGDVNGEHAGATWTAVRSRPAAPPSLGSASDYAF